MVPALPLFSADGTSVAEQKRDTPYCRQADKGINDSADDRVLTAKQPGYDIKLEQTD